MPKKEYVKKGDFESQKKVVFTNLVAQGMSNKFRDKSEEIREYAEANNLLKPDLNEILTRVFQEADISIDWWFKK